MKKYLFVLAVFSIGALTASGGTIPDTRDQMEQEIKAKCSELDITPVFTVSAYNADVLYTPCVELELLATYEVQYSAPVAELKTVKYVSFYPVLGNRRQKYFVPLKTRLNSYNGPVEQYIRQKNNC